MTVTYDVVGTLRAEEHGHQPIVVGRVAYSVENHPQDSRVKINESGVVQTLSQKMGTGGGNVPIVLETRTYSQPRFGEYKDDDTSVTLRAMGADYGGGAAR